MCFECICKKNKSRAELIDQLTTNPTDSNGNYNHPPDDSNLNVKSNGSKNKKNSSIFKGNKKSLSEVPTPVIDYSYIPVKGEGVTITDWILYKSIGILGGKTYTRDFFVLQDGGLYIYGSAQSDSSSDEGLNMPMYHIILIIILHIENCNI